jgi:uncharacterized protein YydD (DUF2326 family)
MIKLDKLYSEPVIFDSISFDYGINIIMGEKSESSDKKIGVGKSICIEFLNYCLLKKISDSRIGLIPKSLFPVNTKIKLDLSFNLYKLTIVRSIDNPDYVVIFKNGEELIFDKVDNASDYLGNLYFEKYPPNITRISFKKLLAPIIRDERSEFKDIIQCYDTKRTIPRDYKPHLFYLNFGIDLYSEIGKIITDLENKTTFYSETKKLLTKNNEIKIQDAKAHLNELESEVNKINTSIEKLKNNESFEIIQSDLIKLEANINELRIRQKAIKYEIKQIDSLPKPENISENELSILFNQFKKGLGDMVEKSLKEVKIFKEKIDGFRNTIVNNRLETLKDELLKLNAEVRKIDTEYSEKLALIDNGDLVKDLKTSINIFQNKNRDLNNLRSLIERYDSAEREKKNLQTKKSNLISNFDDILFEKHEIIESFKNTILDIHEKVMGNREAHFEIKTTSKKDIIEFTLRTDDDGSHTTERMKVFIYDVALLFNDYTKKNHPQFLVHDNLFDKDDDSLEKSLNYLYFQDVNSPNEFQYILTLNRDMVESLERNSSLKFNIDNFKRATYTKDNRFLKMKYTEITKK